MRPLAQLHRLLLLMTVTVGCGGDGGNATVPPPPSLEVAMVELGPVPPTLNVGERVVLTAVARTSRGAVVSSAVVTWTSSAPAIAQVASDGTLTAVGKGWVTITATVNSISARVSIYVDAPYDFEALGVPRVVTHSYIDVARIQRVSRFRSGFGHDYSDGVERCRSMKHYFQPYGASDWSTVTIRAPMDGAITTIRSEQTFGLQLRIDSRAVPAATVVIFHVALDSGIVVGQQVRAGDRLGTHIGNATMSDVAVELASTQGRRLVSYFDAMTDEVFAAYAERGVASRAAMVISASERDAHPLSCDGETFRDPGALSHWVELP